MLRFNFVRVFVLFILCFNLPALMCFDYSLSKPLSGFVQEEEYLKNKPHTVVDVITGYPVPNADIKIPSLGINLKTDKNGRFNLNGETEGPVIMSVNAKGYKPFTLTINNNSFNKPLIIAIEKISKNEIIIDSQVHHLGDNNFSEESENAANFSLKSSGPSFITSFYCGNQPRNTGNIVLRIGSVIGLDTEMAHKLANSKMNSYSSPTKIYINGQKVGELKINGDNQEIMINPNVLMPNSSNIITIETGKNLMLTDSVDYDDMEFANLILEFK